MMAVMAWVPAAWAQGDSTVAAAGKDLGLKWCSECHGVRVTSRRPLPMRRRAGMRSPTTHRRQASLHAFFATPHKQMPNIMLTRETAEIIAYIQSLSRNRTARQAQGLAGAAAAHIKPRHEEVVRRACRRRPAAGPLVVLVVGAVAISFAGHPRAAVGGGAGGDRLLSVSLRAATMVDGAQGQRHDAAPAEAGTFHLIALGGLFLGLDLAVWNWSIHLSSVSNATLLGNAAPIWVAMAGWLFFQERFTWSFLAGLALSIAGIGLLLGGSFSLSVDHAVGDVLGVVAGALWGAYT
jgi:mono/diheme cytochrome c family protein/multidrug transporter EmrE-like cation transporter